MMVTRGGDGYLGGIEDGSRVLEAIKASLVDIERLVANAQADYHLVGTADSCFCRAVCHTVSVSVSHWHASC